MTLTPEEYTACLRRDFSTFLHRSFYDLNPQTPFFPNWHIEVMAAKFEACRLGQCPRLIINVPPRHLKSHCASIAFSAWLLGHNPAAQIINVSYGQDLADKLARDARGLMQEALRERIYDDGTRIPHRHVRGGRADWPWRGVPHSRRSDETR